MGLGGWLEVLNGDARHPSSEERGGVDEQLKTPVGVSSHIHRKVAECKLIVDNKDNPGGPLAQGLEHEPHLRVLVCSIRPAHAVGVVDRVANEADPFLLQGNGHLSFAERWKGKAGVVG